MVKFYRLPDVLGITGVSRSTLLRWIEAGEFPSPVRLSSKGRSVAWSSADIEQWQAGRLEAAQGDAA